MSVYQVFPLLRVLVCEYSPDCSANFLVLKIVVDLSVRLPAIATPTAATDASTKIAATRARPTRARPTRAVIARTAAAAVVVIVVATVVWFELVAKNADY